MSFNGTAVTISSREYKSLQQSAKEAENLKRGDMSDMIVGLIQNEIIPQSIYTEKLFTPEGLPDFNNPESIKSWTLSALRLCLNLAPYRDRALKGRFIPSSEKTSRAMPARLRSDEIPAFNAQIDTSACSEEIRKKVDHLRHSASLVMNERIRLMEHIGVHARKLQAAEERLKKLYDELDVLLKDAVKDSDEDDGSTCSQGCNESHDSHGTNNDTGCNKSHVSHSSRGSHEHAESKSSVAKSYRHRKRYDPSQDGVIIVPEHSSKSGFCPGDGKVIPANSYEFMSRQTTIADFSISAIENSISMSVRYTDSKGLVRWVVNGDTCADAKARYHSGSDTTEIHLDDGMDDMSRHNNKDKPRWAQPLEFYPELTRDDRASLTVRHNLAIKLKKAIQNEFGYSDHLLNILTVPVKGSYLTYAPSFYPRTPASIYGSRALFAGGNYSQRMASELLTAYAVMLLPKSRLYRFFSLHECMQDLSRNTCIDIINVTCRSFCKPLAELTRSMVLKNCSTLHSDETTSKVRRWCQILGQDRCYLWCTVSGPNEKLKGTLFYAATGRDTGQFLRELGIDPDNPALPEDFNLQNLITDGYSSYSSALDIINGLLGEDDAVSHSVCHAHARRRVVEALDSMKLRERFDEYSKSISSERDIDAAVANTRREMPLLSTQALSILRIGLLYSLMFAIERSAKDSTTDALLKIRQNKEAPLFNAIIRECEHLASSSSGFTRKRTGKVECSNGNWSRAVTYILNQKEGLSTFINNAEVSLTNNTCERTVRKPVQARNGGMCFLDSPDGFKAYADLMTLAGTCELNGLNLKEYLDWAIQSMKMRIDELRMRLGIETQICVRPKVVEPEGGFTDADEIEGRLYGSSCVTWFDKVSVEGLDPFSYKSLLDTELKTGIIP